MLNTTYGRRGMAVAPHSLAAESALSILREKGNAIEAMIAAAATIAVVYPHKNGIGGDGFWLIHEPGRPPVGISACGRSAQAIHASLYAGKPEIPFHGPESAITMAGTLAGWQEALCLSQELGGRIPLSRLLADACYYAREGIPVTAGQALATIRKAPEFEHQSGFTRYYLVKGKPPVTGSLFRQPGLGMTLEHLVHSGLDDFYRGELAQSMATDLAAAGSPLRLADFNACHASRVTPLMLRHPAGQIYNMTAPTQGVISLIILNLMEQLGGSGLLPESADFIHLAVEATKQAFRIRDAYVGDPDAMTVPAQSLLHPDFLAPYAQAISMQKAGGWGSMTSDADTVWMGVIDGQGRAVSFIQSNYHEFGSGVVLPSSGIIWQNRGCSFSLNPRSVNFLKPGKLPFHTLNPPLVQFNDGRTLVYGTMGGDGQPQTQAAVFTRYALFNLSLQQAVTLPRWLLGSTWGRNSDTLKLESRFDPAIIAELKKRGHEVETVGAFEESMGHAGAIVHHPSGIFEGAADPRSNGGVAGF